MSGQVDAQVPDLEQMGHALRTSMSAVVDAVPGGPHRPTPLSEQIGLSRVTVSRILRAIEHESPLEVLEAIPGPESLRVAIEGAARLGVDPALVRDATDAIDAFAGVIRERFGTRAALSAAIRPHTHTLQTRVDHAGRADVFKGMRQILGVEARTWLNAMFFAPSPDNPEALAVTTIHGALGMRRLRPDTNVYFTFGPPPQHGGPERDLSPAGIALDDLYTNEPAQVETSLVGGRLRHRLLEQRLGKDAVADMLAVSHDAKGSRRYATPDAPLRGISLFVDIPVRLLVCDVLVHHDVFPGCSPELMVFNPGARGPANPNDPTRQMDRVVLAETPMDIPAGPTRFDVPEAPHYARMIYRVCTAMGASADDFRVHRLLMTYPITSFQYVLAFRASLG